MTKAQAERFCNQIIREYEEASGESVNDLVARFFRNLPKEVKTEKTEVKTWYDDEIGCVVSDGFVE